MCPVGMGTFHQRKLRSCRFDYLSMIRLCDMKEGNLLILVDMPIRLSSDYVITSRDMQEW